MNNNLDLTTEVSIKEFSSENSFLMTPSGHSPSGLGPGPENSFGWKPYRGAVRVDSPNAASMMCTDRWPEGLSISASLENELSWDIVKEEWRWHKTWRLPEVYVHVSALEKVNMNVARLSMVYMDPRAGMREIKMLGSQGHTSPFYSTLVNGKATFSRIRLTGTSNKCGGERFHLLVSLVPDVANSSNEIYSLISSPFCVYSRRDADKTNRGRNQDESSKWSTFPPVMLSNKLAKKTTDKKGSSTTEEITDSWVGIIRYFQAPNIRGKNRYPLLTCLRFSSVLMILRNTDLFPEADERALRNLFCVSGFSLKCALSVCTKCNPRTHKKGTAPLWFVTLRNFQTYKPAHVKWLIDHMYYMKSPEFRFIADPKVLPSKYVPTENVAEMEALYTRLYELEANAKSAPKKSAPSAPSAPLPKIAEPSSTETEGSSRLSQQTLVLRSKYADKDVGSYAKPPLKFDSEQESKRFEQFYSQIHLETESLLDRVSDEVAGLLTNSSEGRVHGIRQLILRCAQSFEVHAFAEESVLFAEMQKRNPGICESYKVDHVRLRDKFRGLYEVASQLSEPTQIFLKGVQFAEVMREHLRKERDHLFPCFLQTFSEEELGALWRAAQMAMQMKSFSLRSQSKDSAQSQTPRSSDSGF
ncbi:hypothetical protein NDN08_003561 [Rhodosorus marinus]|uniref:Hemerythrin-like domain-containing protein n=1 Tax=Rhodosorus marinus TaxID=101924 RepID=A0AAV8UX51_9RHOD|nr:hypothetical protein NDN08_003561 [Rhodosorus marinus]